MNIALKYVTNLINPVWFRTPVRSRLLCVLSLVGLCVPIVVAESLPNIEADIREREEGIEPRLVVWQRNEEPNVAVTVTIRVSDAEYARYGDQLAAVIADLYTAALPKSSITDRVGISYLQERDSLLDHMVETEGTSNFSQTLRTYLTREAYLEEKAEPLQEWNSVAKEHSKNSITLLPAALLLRYRLTPREVDVFLSKWKETLKNPVWVNEWYWKERINSGYRGSIQTQPLIASDARSGDFAPLPMMTGRLSDYWGLLLDNTTISIAIVGNVDAEEVVTLANLYWAEISHDHYGATAFSAGKPELRKESDQNIGLRLPVENRDVLLAWLSATTGAVYEERLAIIANPSAWVNSHPKQLDTVPSVELRKQNWAAQLQMDLDRVETAADRLSLAASMAGWQRWYAIDERLSQFENSPEEEWIRQWRRQLMEVSK